MSLLNSLRVSREGQAEKVNSPLKGSWKGSFSFKTDAPYIHELLCGRKTLDWASDFGV